VALFPYSDPDTLPGLIPPHLKAKPYHLPADMNRYLPNMKNRARSSIMHPQKYYVRIFYLVDMGCEIENSWF